LRWRFVRHDGGISSRIGLTTQFILGVPMKEFSEQWVEELFIGRDDEAFDSFVALFASSKGDLRRSRITGRVHGGGVAEYKYHRGGGVEEWRRW
jgi:hypothetical protein